MPRHFLFGGQGLLLDGLHLLQRARSLFRQGKPAPSGVWRSAHPFPEGSATGLNRHDSSPATLACPAGGKIFFLAPGRRFCRLLTVRGSLRNIFLFSAEYFKQGFLLCRRASLRGLGHGKIPRTAATAGLFSPGSARKGRRIWQGRRRRRLPGPCMNGGWRAWRKGTALHYRKNCLPLNVNRQAGEDGVCGEDFCSCLP